MPTEGAPMNMSEHHGALLDRLLQFPLSDPNASHAFEGRLADDNDWNRGFATRVVAQYPWVTFISFLITI
jgi:hypothetical protein